MIQQSDSETRLILLLDFCYLSSKSVVKNKQMHLIQKILTAFLRRAI